MSSMSRASSDELEKGATGVKAAAAKEVNPRVALWAKVLVDVLAVWQVLFFIGFFMWMVSIANNWWDPWPAVVIVLPITVFALWIKPKTKYAAEPGSGDNNLSNKLLAEK
ncbi:unnamed protein product [Urochloa decumbens]|uniref:Uncharacterized protein n=1 Tax=Urochloa decumbens TaxID=240449 RepID=A0ABC8XPC7_9POAL